LDPSVINEKFVEGGIMNWAAAAPSLGPGLTASKTPGAFTISQYDKQAKDMENISATLVNVKYNDGDAPHWVGVTGTARENNKDYLIIAPTSTADRTVNEARQGQGWILRDDGTVLAPVDNVREYVTFQTKNAF
jgi:hypothetical protein